MTVRLRLSHDVVVNNIMAYISVNETARRLGRSIEQVRRYLREGKLRGQRIGGHWFVDEDAVAVLLSGSSEPIGRVSEATATYEVKPVESTRTSDAKAKKYLIDRKLLREINETAEKIRRESGEIDVVGTLHQMREERDRELIARIDKARGIMSTKTNKKQRGLIDQKLFRRVIENRERIRDYAGEIDVLATLRADREEH